MKKIISALFVLILLTGCTYEEKPKCVKSHQETKVTVSYNAALKKPMPYTRTITVCDEYEEIEE